MADISKLKALFDKAKALGKARGTTGPVGDVVRRALWTPKPSKNNPRPSTLTLIEFAEQDRRPFSMGPGNVLAIAEQATKVTGEVMKDGAKVPVTALDNIINMLGTTGGTWNKRTAEQLGIVRSYLDQAVALAMEILEERTEAKAPAAPAIDLEQLTPEQLTALKAQLEAKK